MRDNSTYWQMVIGRFLRHRLGMAAVVILLVFCLVGIYAPFLASSKPLVVIYGEKVYLPLFRYLFFSGFFTKKVDIFFNLLMFTLPLLLFFIYFIRKRRRAIIILFAIIQMALFAYLAYGKPRDPARDPRLAKQKIVFLSERRQQKEGFVSFWFNMRFLNDYARLNKVLAYRLAKNQHKKLAAFFNGDKYLATLWRLKEENLLKRKLRYLKNMATTKGVERQKAARYLIYAQDKQNWLRNENKKISFILMPLIRPFHWEDDAGGGQMTNLTVPWYELTRTNRKDLVAALIFGIRISLAVGVMAVALALLIGIPIGAIAGYYGGWTDIVICRILEIWESMPIFFMLLLIVAVLQSKSIFIVIAVVGLFGWTSFSRYIRGEFFKQRNLAYVEACYSMGFSDSYIIFFHILPNAIAPVLTLLPFAVMGAITTEAGLSFLGLGEEGSCSWGVLMDEGRSAFPGESYLLWPPAILLTTLLVAIALIGDAFRDVLDPRAELSH